MSQPCPTCGREYDVTLLEFGRAVVCECGERVALQARVRTLVNRDPLYWRALGPPWRGRA